MIHLRSTVLSLMSNSARLPAGLLVALLVVFSLLGYGVLAPATALAQPVAWSLLTNPPTKFCAMAYDSDRHVTVLFGGFNGSTLNGETWEWDGTSWSHRVVSGPSPRGGHAMAYDSDRHVTVLFGGASGTFATHVSLNDTWEWNGTIWTQRIVAGPKPSPRTDHRVVYDSTRQRAVLFGGYDDSTGLCNSETWEWNGAGAGTWTQRTAAGPSARGGAAMAYDTDRNLTMLFGGWNSSGINNGETWEWNGVGAGAWTQRTVAGPSARGSAAMVYDLVHQRTVLFGGNLGNSGNVQPVGDTWEWNGTGAGSWAQVSGGDPSPRESHAMVYDTFQQVAVLFGGYNGSVCNGETWERGGTGWTLRATSGPSPRVEGSAMAYDTDRNTAVLFGGFALPATYHADTWEWNGTLWNQRIVAGPSPSGRYNHAMAYDATHQKTVLFGGQVNANGGIGSNSGETWLWNGTSWTQWLGAGGPSPREGHRMAYDSDRAVIVLFGGWNPSGTVNRETWEWNGAGSGTWTLRSTDGPLPRAEHAMAYDASSHVTVLFGGNVHDSTGGGPTSSNDETWVWNGAGSGSWTRRLVSGPSPRQDHAMVYDRDRNVTVLFGGYDGITGLGNDETWEWSGVGDGTWTRRIVSGPPPLAGQAMTYDTAQRKTLLFGGGAGSTSNPVALGETWEFGTSCSADFNDDGFVNGVDFDGFVFEFYWGTQAADFNGDGFVNGVDFDSFIEAFVGGC